MLAKFPTPWKIETIEYEHDFNTSIKSKKYYIEDSDGRIIPIDASKGWLEFIVSMANNKNI